MSGPIVGATSGFDSTTPKQNKAEQWTDEQRAFVVYYRSLGAPTSGITPLLNARFGISRTENAVVGCIARVHKEEGEESRLLEIANRYSWQKTANEERNALNRTAHRKILYTDEQRAYALYFFARGLSVKNIVSLFNEQFSLDVCFSTLEKFIRRTRSKQKEREEILKAAEQYPWYTDPIPKIHRPLTPTRQVGSAQTNSTNDSGVIAQENQPSPSKDWTKEQKAFLIHHSYRGMKQDVLLEYLNSTFGTNRRKGPLTSVLGWIWRNDELVAQLRQHAEQFDWYTPEAASGTLESQRTEKAQRIRDARKRVSEKKEWYKKVPKNGDFSRFLAPERTEKARRSLLESGSYNSHPIKIEDSDDNNNNIPGISGFRRISSNYGSGRENDLLSTSPLSLDTTDARTANFKSESRDSLLPSMPKFRWMEPRPSDVSGGRANNLPSMSPLGLRTTHDRPTNPQSEFLDSRSTARPEDFPTASPFSAGSPVSSVNHLHRPMDNFNTSSVDHPFRPDANFHSSNANYRYSPNVSFSSPSAAHSSYPDTTFNPQWAHNSAQSHRPNVDFNSSSLNYASSPNASFNFLNLSQSSRPTFVNSSSANYPSSPNASFNSLNTSQPSRPRIVNPASTNFSSHPQTTIRPPFNSSSSNYASSPNASFNSFNISQPFRPTFVNPASTNLSSHPHTTIRPPFNSSSSNYASSPHASFNSFNISQPFRPTFVNSSSANYASSSNASFNSLNTSQPSRPRIANPASTYRSSHPHTTFHPPSNLSAYAPVSAHHAPNAQPSTSNLFPPGTPPPHVNDVLLAWAPNIPDVPSTSRRQVSALDRRSRSPRSPKEERFGFGDSDDDGTDERRFLRPTRREMRHRERLERSERRG